MCATFTQLLCGSIPPHGIIRQYSIACCEGKRWMRYSLTFPTLCTFLSVQGSHLSKYSFRTESSGSVDIRLNIAHQSRYTVLKARLCSIVQPCMHVPILTHSLKFSRLKIFTNFTGQSMATKIFSHGISSSHNRYNAQLET